MTTNEYLKLGNSDKGSSGHGVKYISPIFMGAIDASAFHPVQFDHGANCFPLPKMAGNNNRPFTSCVRLFQGGKAGARASEFVVLRLKFSIVVYLKKCSPHMPAHILTKLPARAALHIGKNSFCFAVKSASCRRKPTHDRSKSCAQTTGPQIKGAPAKNSKRRPQREVSSVM